MEKFKGKGIFKFVFFHSSLQQVRFFMRKTLFAGVFTLAIMICGSAGAAAESVAVLPFATHAPTDIRYLAEGTADMLGSRLAAAARIKVIDTPRARITGHADPLDRSAAIDIGKKLGADYVLWGSITQIGARFSLDAEVVDVSGQTAPVALFEQADALGALIPAVNALAARVASRVFAAPPSDTETADPPAASGQAHPEKLLGTISAGAEGKTSAAAPASPNPRPSVSASNNRAAPVITTEPAPAKPFIAYRSTQEEGFWKSDNWELTAVGLAVADIDGDAAAETILLGEKTLLVQKKTADGLAPLAQWAAARHEKYLAVDAADTDDNGRAEIFITAVNPHSRNLCSLVLVWEAGDLKAVIRDRNWYFRAMDETTVWGQKKGMSDLFLPGARCLKIRGTDLVPGEPVDLPAGACIFDVARGALLPDGHSQWVLSDSDDHLVLYSSEGEKLWKSDTAFGGSETYLKTAAGDHDSSPGRRYLSQRLCIADLDQDGRNEVVTVVNQSLSSRWFKRYRKYAETAVVGLAWDGLGLSERWRTRKISGYAADFAWADMDGDGIRELALFIVSKRDSLFSAPRSCLILYDTARKQNN